MTNSGSNFSARLSILPEKTREAAGEAASSGLCKVAAVAGEKLVQDRNVMAGPDFAGNVMLVTLGCAKNLVDSEIMLGNLVARGFQPVVEAEQADLIVVNTCAFLQSAVDEGIDRILELSELKKNGRCKRLVVAGCMVERYRGQLVEALPEVDQFVSTDELLNVGAVSETTDQCFEEARRPYFVYDESMPRLRSTGGHTAYVKVSEGCNRPCTFCIIPKIRGSFRSRQIDSIVKEVENLVLDGVKEVNFVAQDLTAFGSDLDSLKKPKLGELLARIGEQAKSLPTHWIRLLYAYPVGVTEELMRTISETPNICSYLDIPLQHISNDVLKRMHRPLGEKGTRRLVEQMRAVAPDVALRTTFIVGFPGETEQDVDLLEEFIREGHFTHVGIFTYSQEEESQAFSLPDQVSDEIKNARKERLMQVQQEIVAKRLAAWQGQRVRVLVDGAHSDTDLLMVGRTEWQAPETDGEVIINDVDDLLRNDDGDIGAEQLRGRFVEVEITEIAGYDLVGRLVSVD